MIEVVLVVLCIAVLGLAFSLFRAHRNISKLGVHAESLSAIVDARWSQHEKSIYSNRDQIHGLASHQGLEWHREPEVAYYRKKVKA